MVSESLVLREAAPPTELEMPRHVATELVRLGIADVVPSAGDERWVVSGVRKVGVLRVGECQVVIHPKIPIRSLIELMAYADDQVAWRADSVSVDAGDLLTNAIARAFASALERATARGLTRSYRAVEVSSQVVRGRWDVGRQVRHGRGAFVPVEIEFDEFDVDTAANRVLLAAAVLLVRVPGLDVGVARRLRSVIARFDGVALIASGVRVAEVSIDRRNAHLAPALRLARLVLQRRGIEHYEGANDGAAFLVTMSTVFERFVEAEVVRAGRAQGVDVLPQFDVPLDLDGHVHVRPDLTLRYNGRVVGIFDAKYKQEKPAGYPNADVYQALTYAVRHGLREATLIYARGLGPEVTHHVEQVDITIRCVALDLTARHDEMIAPLHDLVCRAIGSGDDAHIADDLKSCAT